MRTSASVAQRPALKRNQLQAMPNKAEFALTGVVEMARAVATVVNVA